MKKLILIGVGLSLALILGVIGFTRLSQSQSIPVIENSVTGISSDIQSSTNVPLALPSSLPFNQTYYSSVGEVDEDHYIIHLDSSQECLGVLNCRLGVVSGEVASVQTIDDEFGNLEGFKPVAKSPNEDQVVSLINGLQGRFIPYVCGANCSTSKLVWGQDGYRYMVGIQAKSVPEDQEVQALIDMANTAISNRK